MESKAFLKSQSVHMCCALFRLADSEAASTRKMAVSVPSFLQRYPCWDGCRTFCSSQTVSILWEIFRVRIFRDISSSPIGLRLESEGSPGFLLISLLIQEPLWQPCAKELRRGGRKLTCRIPV